MIPLPSTTRAGTHFQPMALGAVTSSVPQDVFCGGAAKVEPRRSQLARLRRGIMQTTVQDPELMRDYFTDISCRLPVAAAQALGMVSEAATLHAALRFEHPHAALRPADLMLLTSKSDPESVVLAALFSDKATKRPAGFLLATLSQPTRRIKELHIDYAVVDQGLAGTRGVVDSYLERLSAWAASIGVTRQTLEAAWVGRLAWALKGFDSDRKTIRDLRERFTAYIAHHHLSPEALRVQEEDGSQQRFSPMRLQHTWDFAHVVAEDGAAVESMVLSGDELRQRQQLSVGRAFLLQDPEGALEPIAAPMWEGQRPTRHASPGQQQYRAYRARRHAPYGQGAAVPRTRWTAR